MDIDAQYDKKRDEPITAHKLKVITWPDDRLHEKCDNVTSFDDDGNKTLTQLFINLAHTMVTGQGIGIAAPQVGVMINMLVMLHQNPIINKSVKTPGTGKSEPIALVNPRIISSSEDMFSWSEGCLSVPGFFEERTRPNKVVVQFRDIYGENHEMEFHGLYAFVVQHEIDHLNGKLFIDELSRIKKSLVVKKKIKKFLQKNK